MRKIKIRKGNHYSLNIPKPYIGRKKEFEVEFKFDPSCKYTLGKNALGEDDDYDVNKLWGVSFGYHKKNSFRFGWNSIGSDPSIITPYEMGEKSIALFYYAYNNGKLSYEQIGVVNVGSTGKFKVTFDFESNRIVLLNELSNEAPVYFPFEFPEYFIGYHLHPYFGGNRTAVHDTLVHLSVK